jgi:GntR family transcriptional repressor for pyruvate dehydrogenase complex
MLLWPDRLAHNISLIGRSITNLDRKSVPNKPGNNKTNRLYQRVANTLARDIRTRKFVPEQRLPAERDLAHRFEVSRPTIREAIIALEISGLVDVRKGSGVYVRDESASTSEMSELDIGPFELIEARMLFECEIAGLAAELITDDQIKGLETILKDMEKETLTGASSEIADREFHLSIARITNNSAVVGTLEYLWDVRRHSPLCIRLMSEVRTTNTKPIVQQHQVVLDAIATRDPEQAKSAMREHLAGAIERLLAATEIDAMERAREEVARQRKRYGDRAASE